MTSVSLGAIASVRAMMQDRVPMASICALLNWAYTRDDLVEIIDACRRHETDHAAQRHVNLVLAWQQAGMSLVNGKPSSEVLANCRAAYEPMF